MTDLDNDYDDSGWWLDDELCPECDGSGYVRDYLGMERPCEGCDGSGDA